MTTQLINDELITLLIPHFVRNTGELHLSIEWVTSDYTAGAGSVLLVTTEDVDVTITLPDVHCNLGKVYAIKKIDSGTGYVVITPQSGQQIEGIEQTYAITRQLESLTLVSDGTSGWWFI